ncbi:MAG TPA: hypothetical protein VLV55_01890 [Rhizomicrobium sp.]|nr:hypothetical protein [Rhizomicrobium sp.]
MHSSTNRGIVLSIAGLGLLLSGCASDDTAVTTANQALQVAQGAQATASQASSDAQQAQQTAVSAQQSADQAKALATQQASYRKGPRG